MRIPSKRYCELQAMLKELGMDIDSEAEINRIGISILRFVIARELTDGQD